MYQFGKGKENMKLNTLFARQGDVNFITATIPSAAKRISLRPFALGEVTGHSHRVITADEPLIEMYELDGETYVRVSGDCAGVHIRHEEHDPDASVSVLPAGWEGRIVIAEEYDEEEGFRRVAD
jgi:hypothetical protein